MPEDVNRIRDDRDKLRREIRDESAKIRRAARRYRRLSGTLIILALISGALGTALAGEAFRGGSVSASVAQATTGVVPKDLPKGWRNVCGLIALLTFIGTVATGLNSMLKMTEHQTKAFLCAGAFDALETELLRDTDIRQQVLDRVIADLKKCRQDSAEYRI
jgi:hypothetical protein